MYFEYRTQQIRAALTRATTAVLRVTAPQLQQGAAGAAQGQTEQRKLTVEQRRNLLAEPSLAGSNAPATHQQSTQPRENAALATDSRAELLAQAEMAGVVRKGAALASRFVKAGEAPTENEATTTTSAGVSITKYSDCCCAPSPHTHPLCSSLMQMNVLLSCRAQVQEHCHPLAHSQSGSQVPFYAGAGTYHSRSHLKLQCTGGVRQARSCLQCLPHRGVLCMLGPFQSS